MEHREEKQYHNFERLTYILNQQKNPKRTLKALIYILSESAAKR